MTVFSVLGSAANDASDAQFFNALGENHSRPLRRSEVRMVILRLLLLCLSMLGFVLFLNKKYRIDLAFAPALSVSFILVIVFLSGIIGILSWIVYVLLALGVALFVWMLI